MKIAWNALFFAYWKPIMPEALDDKKRMIGGGETAVIELTEAMAELGHEVHVYGHCPDKPKKVWDSKVYPRGKGKLIWHRAEKWVEDHNKPFDVLVVCEDSHWFHQTNAKLNVMHIQLNHPTIIPELVESVNLYVCVSGWHMQSVLQLYPWMAKDSALVTHLPEAINLKYSQAAKPIEKTKNRVVYASSPDRGLHHFLEIWPRVKAKVPEAELHVYYGALNWATQASHLMEEQGLAALKILELERREDVYFYPPMDKWTLAEEMQKACILAYPCDTVLPSEGYCITILLANAAGTPVVTTDCDAFGEVHSRYSAMLPLPLNAEDFADAIIELLTDKTAWRTYSVRGLRRTRECTWDKVALKWEKLFLEGLAHVNKARRSDTRQERQAVT